MCARVSSYIRNRNGFRISIHASGSSSFARCLLPFLTLVNNLYSLECFKYTPRAHCCLNRIYSRAQSIAYESNVSCKYTSRRRRRFTPNWAFYSANEACIYIMCPRLCNGACASAWHKMWTNKRKRTSAKIKERNVGGDDRNSQEWKNYYFLIKYPEWGCVHASNGERKDEGRNRKMAKNQNKRDITILN